MRLARHASEAAAAIRADRRRGLKDVAGRALFRSGQHARAFEDRAIVTCFHAIDDEHESPIACTSAEFDEWLEFFGAHFDVIPLTALLSRLESGRDISGALSITFDDGYRDNYTLALPALERRGMHATFFVASSFISSRHQAWWDSDCGITSEWMSWDEVRDLYARGFDVGVHTRTHSDLGAVDFADAIAEIDGATEDIERELGVRPTLFAYPFGGVDNITDAVRTYVAQSGLRCCPSAFGGLVRPTTDPFDLPRIPITRWYLTPYQMGFEAARLRGRDPTPHKARSRPDQP